MKTLHKFLQLLQSIAKLDFRNKSFGIIKEEQLLSETESLLYQMNSQENEFLFI